MAVFAKKNGETLSVHTLACIKAAEKIIDTLALPDDVRNKFLKEVVIALSLHDVGKGAAGFQKALIGSSQRWGKRHEILSAAIASMNSSVSESSVFAILTHHKTIPLGISAITSPYPNSALPDEQIPIEYTQKPAWNAMLAEWRERREEIKKEMEPVRIFFKMKKDYGFVMNFDHFDQIPFKLSLDEKWLDRNEQLKLSVERRLHASLIRGIVISADHLGSAHKFPDAPLRLGDYPVIEFPRSFQVNLGRYLGSAILRAPTGSGKTEAAILWAQSNQRPNGRLYYVLPYTASANAMRKRLERIFGSDKIGLLHHRAVSSLYHIMETDGDRSLSLEKQARARELVSLAREIWYPLKVCTPHQLLKFSLRGKGWEGMLNEFRDACFIFDEVHAYDPRIIGLILGSVRLLQKIGFSPRVLFLSATMPSFLVNLIKNNVSDIPLFELEKTEISDNKILVKKRHTVKIFDGTIVDHFDQVLKAAGSGKSILIVCNHVKSAQTIYDLLLRTFPSDKLILLHSRFNSEDRDRIEQTINRGENAGKILISTQVVEVSLDIDFDLGFLEPAPIDAMIQRMGRINRTGEKKDAAQVSLFSKQLHSYNLYCNCSGQVHVSHCIVKRTLIELENLANPISESDLVCAADKVYEDGYIGANELVFTQGLEHPMFDISKSLVAGAYEEWSDEFISKSDGNIYVLPNSLCQEYKKRMRNGFWIEAESLLVPIRFRSLVWLKPTRYLDQLVVDSTYSKKTGLIIKSKINPDTDPDEYII